MTRLKWDSSINLQHLVTAVATLMISMTLAAFSLKGKVEMNERDIEELKNFEKRLDERLDGLKDLMIEIKLDLKDKADRKDG